MKIKKSYLFGIIFGALLILLDLVFFSGVDNKNFFLFLLGIAISVIVLPFVIGLAVENKKGQEISDMFLEFSRNLAESVAAGTPISKSIENMRDKNYGSLTPYIQKLGNQISIGIPVDQALHNFAYEVDNPVITRAVSLISEAEKAGGEIEYILESSAKAIAEIEKLKKERKSAISSLVVQGYIIFIIFIGIMLVMEFKIMPLTAGISVLGSIGSSAASFNAGAAASASPAYSPSSMASPFLFLLISQGFFAGLMIGKLAEGTVKAGIKHSFILVMTAILVSTGANVIFGG